MDLFTALGDILRPEPTTSQILAELHNPNNYVRIEWCTPETVSNEDRERIREEAENFRKSVTADLIEEDFPFELETALQAASMFLDLAADHGIYETVSVTLNRIGE
jgi:hypothetical protein